MKKCYQLVDGSGYYQGGWVIEGADQAAIDASLANMSYPGDWTYYEVADESFIVNASEQLKSDLANSSDVAKGDALVAVKQPLTGAVGQTQHNKNAQNIDLTDFGNVDTSGSSDMSSLIANALSAIASTGGVLNLPVGIIKCNITLNISGITLRGKGKRSTKLIPASNTPIISIGNASVSMVDCHIEEIGFDNTAGVSTTAPAISFINTLQINDAHVLKNLFIQYFPYGVSITGRCILSMFEGVEVLNSSVNGYYIVPVATAVVNHLKFQNCRSYISLGHGFFIDNQTNNPSYNILGINFDHCDFEYACANNSKVAQTTNSIAGVYAKGVEGLTFSNECYFENNGTACGDSLGANIRITGSSAPWFSIKNSLLWSSQNSIIIDASLATGEIIANRLAGSVSTLNIATTSADSRIIVGGNYDTGTHTITPDPQVRTHVCFLNPLTLATYNTSWSGTPSVAGQNVLFHTGGAVTITDFLNGEMGQIITVYINAGSIAFTHANTNGLYMQGAKSATYQAGASISFVNSGKTGGTALGRGWVQIAATQQDARRGANVASATTITPTGDIFHVTGTTAIDTINLPYTGFQGSITLIPDGVFTTTTSGNIALASTAVVSKSLVMTYDSTSAKWFPSY